MNTTDEHSEHRPHQPSSSQRSITRHVDVAVIGGSAAGLAAALQLSRQRRSVIVVDSGTPRNAPAEAMHSYLGHEGRSPADFLDIARAEVRSYGAEVLHGEASNVTQSDEGFRIHLTGGTRIYARRVIAATGHRDELPKIPGLTEHWGTSVFHCPFCHGYEVRDQAITAIVTSAASLHALPLLRQLTSQLKVVIHQDVSPDDPQMQKLQAAGVQIYDSPVARVVNDEHGTLQALELADGSQVISEAVLVGSRLHPRVDAFRTLGLGTTEHPSGLASYVEADPMTGATSLPGLYAAGTLTEPALQVLPTAAAGTRVGSMVSFDLANEDLEAAARPLAHAADWDGRYRGEQQWSGNPNGSLVAEIQSLPAGTALDIGAGEGGDAIWLAQQGWNVTASDISQHALERVSAGAKQHGVPIQLLNADANAARPFGGRQFDLVTASYASIPRTPDHRGIANFLNAVAPGGQLLIVNHDGREMRAVLDSSGHVGTRPFDHEAFVSTEDFTTALEASSQWEILVNERRDRPHGAVSSHHVRDEVLRARRLS